MSKRKRRIASAVALTSITTGIGLVSVTEANALSFDSYNEQSSGFYSGVKDFSASAWGDFVVFIKNDGTAWFKGACYYGEAGQGVATGTYTEPVRIVLPGDKKAKRIFAGASAVYIRAEDDTTYVCGDNTYGLCGQGSSVTNVYTPTLLSGITGLKDVVVNSSLINSSTYSARQRGTSACFLTDSENAYYLGRMSKTNEVIATPKSISDKVAKVLPCSSSYLLLVRGSKIGMSNYIAMPYDVPSSSTASNGSYLVMNVLDATPVSISCDSVIDSVALTTTTDVKTVSSTFGTTTESRFGTASEIGVAPIYNNSNQRVGSEYFWVNPTDGKLYSSNIGLDASISNPKELLQVADGVFCLSSSNDLYFKGTDSGAGGITTNVSGGANKLTSWTKVLSNVKDVFVGQQNTHILTTDGKLYVYGSASSLVSNKTNSLVEVTSTYSDTYKNQVESAVAEAESCVSSSPYDSSVVGHIVSAQQCIDTYKSQGGLSSVSSAFQTRLDAVQAKVTVVENNATSLVVTAESTMKTGTYSALSSAYSSANSVVSSMHEGTVRTDLTNRLRVISAYMSKLKSASDSVATLEGYTTITDSNIDSAISAYNSACTGISALNNGYQNQTDLQARANSVKSRIDAFEVSRVSSAKTLVETAESYKLTKTPNALKSAYDSAKVSVDKLLSSTPSKQDYLNRLGVVLDYYTNKLLPADQSVSALTGLGTITNSNLGDAKTKYADATAKVNALSDGTYKSAQKSTVDSVGVQISNLDALNDATALVGSAESVMKTGSASDIQASYSVANIKATSLVDSSSKSSLLSRLSAVNTYYTKFKKAEDSVNALKAIGNVTNSNLSNAKLLFATASVDTSNLTEGYSNASGLKAILANYNTQIVNLDALNNATSLVTTAETAMKTKLSSNILSAHTDANTAVSNLVSGSDKTGLQNRLAVVLSYYTSKLKPAEDSVIALENLGTITNSNLGNAKSLYNSANASVGSLNSASQGYTNTTTLSNRLVSIKAQIDNLDALNDATSSVVVAEGQMQTGSASSMKSAYDTAYGKVNSLVSGSDKTGLSARLSTVLSYYTKYSSAEVATNEVVALGTVTSSNLESVRTKYSSAKSLLDKVTEGYSNANTLKTKLSAIKSQLDNMDALNSATSLVTTAETAMSSGLSSDMYSAYTSAKSSVDALSDSISGKTDLVSRYTTVYNYYNTKFKPAEDSLKVLEALSTINISNLQDAQSKYSTANSKISALVSSYSNTTILSNRLSTVKAKIDGVVGQTENSATSLVITAEELRYTDVSTNYANLYKAISDARSGVNSLTSASSSVQSNLSTRLDNVLSYYTRLIESEKLVVKAEVTSPASQGLVDSARTYIQDTSASLCLDQSATNTMKLLERLGVVQTRIDKDIHDKLVAEVESLLSTLQALQYTDTSSNYQALLDSVNSFKTQVTSKLGSYSSDKTYYEGKASEVLLYRDTLIEATRLVTEAQKTPLTSNKVESARSYISTNLREGVQNTKVLTDALILVDNSIEYNEKIDNLKADLSSLLEKEKTLASSSLELEYNKVKERVDALSTSDSNYSSLSSQLSNVLSYINKLKIAEGLVSVSETKLSASSVDEALSYINSNLLPKENASNTLALYNRLLSVQQIIDTNNAIASATHLVGVAESSMTYTDYSIALEAVNSLGSSSSKTALQNRLSILSQSMQSRVIDATTLVVLAEKSTSTDTVSQAYTKVNSLPADCGEKRELLNRLGVLDAKLSDLAYVKTVEDAIESAKSSLIQSDLDKIKDMLPNIQDQASKEDLTAKLNGLQEKVSQISSIESSIKHANETLSSSDLSSAKEFVDSLPNGSKKSELLQSIQDVEANISKAESISSSIIELGGTLDSDAIRDLENLISSLPDGGKKQELLDALNSIKSDASKAEDIDSRLTEVSGSLSKDKLADLEKEVSSLPDGSKKQELIDKINAIKDSISVSDSIKDSLAKVESSLIQSELDKVKDEIAKLPNGSQKDELMQQVSQIQDSITRTDKVDIELGAIENEFNSSGMSKGELDNIKQQVSQLPASDRKTELENKISEIEANIDKVTEINNELSSILGSLDQGSLNALIDKVNSLPDSQLKNDLLNKVNEAQNKVTDASNLNSKLDGVSSSLDQSELDKIKAEVSAMPDGSKKDELLDRINKIESTIKDTSNASNILNKPDGSLSQSDIDSVKDMISKLPDGSPVKEELQNKLDAVQKTEDAFKDLENRLNDASVTLKQEELDKIKEDLTSMPDGDRKESLKDEVDKLQDTLNNLNSVARELVSKAENSLLNSDLTTAKNAVDSLTDIQLQADLRGRLDSIKAKIQSLIDSATAKVALAESALTKETVLDAQACIDELRADYVEKLSLQSRLDVVKASLDAKDYENLVLGAIEDIEISKDVGKIQDIQDMINKLPEGEKRDELQNKLDQAVNSSISDTTTTDDLSNMQDSIASLPAGELREELQNKVIEVIRDKLLGVEQSKDIEGLSKLQDIINKLPTSDIKQELQNKVIVILDSKLSEILISKDLNELDKVLELVSKLPDGTLKDLYINKVNTIRDSITNTAPPADTTIIGLQNSLDKIISTLVVSNSTTEESLTSMIQDNFLSSTGLGIKIYIKGFTKVYSSSNSVGAITASIVGVVQLNGDNYQLVSPLNATIKLAGNSSGSHGSHNGSSTNSGVTDGSSETNAPNGNLGGSSVPPTSGVGSIVDSKFDIVTGSGTVDSSSSVSTGEVIRGTIDGNVDIPIDIEKVPEVSNTEVLKVNGNSVGLLINSDSPTISFKTDAQASSLFIYTYIDALGKYIEATPELTLKDGVVSFESLGNSKYIVSTIQLSTDILAVQQWNALDNNNWAYVEGQDVKTGWVLDSSNTWYHMNDQARMSVGWLKDDNTWYYLNPISNGSRGSMKTGWVLDGDKWYYMSSNGSMQTGWIKDGNSWYYLTESGRMQTGWFGKDDAWYYFDKSGKMLTGNQEINGNTYFFSTSGALQ